MTWLKQDDRIVEFATMQEAGAKAKDLTDSAAVTDVKYTVKKFDVGRD